MNKKEDIFKREVGKTLHGPPRHVPKLFAVDQSQHDSSPAQNTHHQPCDIQVRNNNSVDQPPRSINGGSATSELRSPSRQTPGQNSYTSLTRSTSGGSHQSNDRQSYLESGGLNETRIAGGTGNITGSTSESNINSAISYQSDSGAGPGGFYKAVSRADTQVNVAPTRENSDRSQNISRAMPPVIAQRRSNSGDSVSQFTSQYTPKRPSLLRHDSTSDSCITLNELQSGK